MHARSPQIRNRTRPRSPKQTRAKRARTKRNPNSGGRRPLPQKRQPSRPLHRPRPRRPRKTPQRRPRQPKAPRSPKPPLRPKKANRMTTQGELCFAPNAVNQWKRKMERSSAFAAKWNFLKIWPKICALYSLRGPLNPRISHSRRNLDIASEEGGIAPVVESGCKRKIRGLSDVHSVMEIWQDTSVNWLNYILTSKTSSSGWHRHSC